MVPILINRGVFEPSCNDLKFTDPNRNYFCKHQEQKPWAGLTTVCFWEQPQFQSLGTTPPKSERRQGL